MFTCETCGYRFKYPSIKVLNDYHECENCCPKCRTKIEFQQLNSVVKKYAIRRYEILKLINVS